MLRNNIIPIIYVNRYYIYYKEIKKYVDIMLKYYLACSSINCFWVLEFDNANTLKEIYVCIPESINTNLIYYLIACVNSQHTTTN